MTLLLNYRPVLSQPTGIGVYAAAVLPALQQFPHRLVVGGGKGGARQRLQRLAWTQLQLPCLARRQRASLIFTPAPEGYLGPQVVPQVVMVHDLRPLSHPGLDLQSLYFRAWVPSLLQECFHVIANSSFTAKEIKERARIPESRISVIPLGIDHGRFNPRPVQELFLRDCAPYLLHVGQAYPHKNIQRLIRAFSWLAKIYPELKLLLVGKPHPFETRRLRIFVDELGLREKVVFMSYCDIESLADLYRGAVAFVYPSLWEGFGLPVLEAMACGTPVVTSVGSAIEEVAGDSALMIDPHNVNEIFSAVDSLMRQPGLREELRGKGLRQAALFDWGVTASKTARLVDDLMGAQF